jgi:hypothetical protein
MVSFPLVESQIELNPPTPQKSAEAGSPIDHVQEGNTMMVEWLNQLQTSSYTEEDLSNPSFHPVEQRYLNVETRICCGKPSVNIGLTRFRNQGGKDFNWQGSLKELINIVEGKRRE